MDLLVEGGARITTTEDHPFYNTTDQQWQPADQLNPGDHLHTAGTTVVRVQGLDPNTQRTTTTYNLTITDLHTYHVLVSNTPVLVHNDCRPLSPNQMNQMIRRGNAPDGIHRIDIGKVTGEQTHAVFGRGQGAPSLNIDGTWKHGYVDLTNKQRDWLRANGWNI